MLIKQKTRSLLLLLYEKKLKKKMKGPKFLVLYKIALESHP